MQQAQHTRFRSRTGRVQLTLAVGALAMLVGSLGVQPRVVACVNDRDTDSYEKRFPMIAQVLTGRFDRNPSMYYMARIGRVEEALLKKPDALDLYDDLGAAHDRLGQPGKAIATMALKKTRLDVRQEELESFDTERDDEAQQSLLEFRRRKMEEKLYDASYRYHANIGTFYAHRWLKRRDASQMQDMLEARKHIAEAIRINPDAHFGREIYQLMAIDWIIEVSKVHAALEANPGAGATSSDSSTSVAPADDEPTPGVGNDTGNDISEGSAAPSVKKAVEPTPTPQASNGPLAKLQNSDPAAPHYVPTLGTYILDRLEKEPRDDAVKGLSGLIALGAAWQSVDVTDALRLALDRNEDHNVAFLAELRRDEIIGNGGRSLANPSLEGEALKQWLGASSTVADSDRGRIKAYFADARKEADDWHGRREHFIMAGINKGNHPDTDKAFFKGFDEGTPVPSDAVNTVDLVEKPRRSSSQGTGLTPFSPVQGLAIAAGVFGLAMVILIALRKPKGQA